MTWQLSLVVVVAILASVGVWALWLHRTTPRDDGSSRAAAEKADEALRRVEEVRRELHSLATVMGFRRTTAPPPMQPPPPTYPDSTVG